MYALLNVSIGNFMIHFLEQSEADRQLDDIVTRTFEELDAEGKKYLEEKGYSKGLYDTLNVEARRKLWICMF